MDPKSADQNPRDRLIYIQTRLPDISKEVAALKEESRKIRVNISLDIAPEERRRINHRKIYIQQRYNTLMGEFKGLVAERKELHTKAWYTQQTSSVA